MDAVKISPETITLARHAERFYRSLAVASRANAARLKRDADSTPMSAGNRAYIRACIANAKKATAHAERSEQVADAIEALVRHAGGS